MKVLFTHSYFLKLDPKQLKARSPYPPLATLYAAALLRENKHEVFLADLQFGTAEDIADHIRKHAPQVLVIYDDGFNYLSKMCLTNMRDSAFRMQKIAKEMGLKVIVSSSDATDHSAEYLRKGADYIINGEAEISLLELVLAMENEGEISTIEGLSYLQQGRLVRNRTRTVIRNLDTLPPPAWDLVDFRQYKKMWTSSHGYFSLNMVTTRGCPYKCNWCAKPIYGNRYNCHSPGRIVKDIISLSNLVAFDHIWFCDDIFGLKPGWVAAFSEELKKSNVKIRYKIQSRVDLLDEETVAALSASGCEEVWLGAESGSQKILDAMEKGTRVEQIRSATMSLKRAGIRPCFFLQFGYPGETAQDIHCTLKMLDELEPHDIGISVSYPLPGTAFYEKVKTQLAEKKNWTDSDELLVMFKSTYPSSFYRDLQRFVHYRFRARASRKKLAAGGGNLKPLAFLPYYMLRQNRFKRKLRLQEPLAEFY